MSFLKKSFVLIFSSWTLYANASSIRVPNHHFYVEVRGRYDFQWTMIFKDFDVWACQTDLLPYREAKENPLADLNWKELKKESTDNLANCESKVLVIDRRGKKTEQFKTCLNNPKIKKWVDTLYQRCGRT